MSAKGFIILAGQPLTKETADRINQAMRHLGPKTELAAGIQCAATGIEHITQAIELLDLGKDSAAIERLCHAEERVRWVLTYLRSARRHLRKQGGWLPVKFKKKK